MIDLLLELIYIIIFSVFLFLLLLNLEFWDPVICKHKKSRSLLFSLYLEILLYF